MWRYRRAFADRDVFHFLDITAKLNRVSTETLPQRFEKLRKGQLSQYDALIAADICFWDELEDPVFLMVNRAIKAGVKDILISDPERPPFMRMAKRCIDKHGGAIKEVNTRGSIKARGVILSINNR